MKEIIQERPSLDVLSREQIILKRANRDLVDEIARQYADFGVEHDILVEEGLQGLDIAVQKYQQETDCPFSVMAKWWIKRKISDVILKSHKRN